MSQTVSRRQPGGPRPRPNLALLEARIRAGLSRDDLGRLAGVSGKQIGLIERGVARKSRASTLAGISTALEQDVMALFPLRRLLP